MEEILRRVAQVERQLATMVRVGIVDTVDREKCRATVCFPRKRQDDPGSKTKPLPVLVKQTRGTDANGKPDAKGTRDYWMPEIGQWVVVVSLPAGVPGVDSFIVGSWYGNQDTIPDGAADKGMRVTEFSDGARVEYSTEESKLRVLVGDLETELTKEHIRFGGESGNQPFLRGTDTRTLLEALIDLIVSHTHPTGVGPSGPPANAAAFSTKRGEVAALLSPIIFGR